jgi:hypothetical protein
MTRAPTLANTRVTYPDHWHGLVGAVTGGIAGGVVGFTTLLASIFLACRVLKTLKASFGACVLTRSRSVLLAEEWVLIDLLHVPFAAE